jgi:hypothetical protein
MKSKLRWAVDGGLTVCLLLLMGYELIGQTHFAFFDYDEPLALFYLDYLAIMGLLTAAGYYLSKLLKNL